MIGFEGEPNNLWPRAYDCFLDMEATPQTCDGLKKTTFPGRFWLLISRGQTLYPPLPPVDIPTSHRFTDFLLVDFC